MNSRETRGMLLGLVGVMIFSLTLPMTRIVVAEIHPLLNGLGRALAAAIPAATLLWWRREPLPTRAQLKSLAVVSAGVIVAFPVFSVGAPRRASRPARAAHLARVRLRRAVLAVHRLLLFAWYAGLAIGGIARVGQVQLLQIFFTIAFSALLFGETVAPSTWLFAAAVIATVMLGRRAAPARSRKLKRRAIIRAFV